ncbi:MAG: hypothetical protein JXA24_03895 [Proteobacteria bacterium]|nr:hypothetical protein [Pseudomonadota bacterium]
MSDNAAKCGLKGVPSGACKAADYQDCDNLGSADLTQLISYNGHGLGTVETGLDRRKFKRPAFKQIRDMDWAKFSSFEGVCKRGSQWFAYRQRQAAQPEAQPSAAAGPAGEKDTIEWLFDPIEEGIEHLLKGRYEKALEKAGWERAAGVAAAGIAALILVFSLARMPFKAAKKRRLASERRQALLADRRLEEARMAAARAEAAARMAQIAAERSPVPMYVPIPEPIPVPAYVQAPREDTPIPLVPTPVPEAPSSDSARFSGIPVDGSGRAVVESNVPLRPDATPIDSLTAADFSVDFDVIAALMEIDPSHAKETERTRIEGKYNVKINQERVKEAGLISREYFVTNRDNVKEQVRLTVIEILEKAAERAGRLGFAEVETHDVVDAAVSFSRGELPADEVTIAARRARPWFSREGYHTKAYVHFLHDTGDSGKVAREVVKVGDSVVPPPPGERGISSRDKNTVEVRPEGIPPAVDSRELRPTGMVPAPQMTDRSVTADVVPERLAEMEESARLRKARAGTVVFSGEDGELFSGFSEKDLMGGGAGIEWGKGGVPAHAEPHYDPAAVMRRALEAIDSHERYRDLTDTDKARLADVFAAAVVGKRAIPGFAKDFFPGGRVDSARFAEAVEVAQDILGPSSPGAARSRGGPERRTARSESRARSGSFVDPFDGDSEIRGIVEDVLKKGGK